MKQFDELYNLVAEKNEELPTIYCDMDMVFCDFLKGAEEVLGVPFPQYPDKKEKWKKISSTPNFWEKLNWMLELKGCGISSTSMMHTFCLPIQPMTQTVEKENLHG